MGGGGGETPSLLWGRVLRGPSDCSLREFVSGDSWWWQGPGRSGHGQASIGDPARSRVQKFFVGWSYFPVGEALSRLVFFGGEALCRLASFFGGDITKERGLCPWTLSVKLQNSLLTLVLCSFLPFAQPPDNGPPPLPTSSLRATTRRPCP